MQRDTARAMSQENVELVYRAHEAFNRAISSLWWVRERPKAVGTRFR
jgi:hypothetical protein